MSAGTPASLCSVLYLTSEMVQIKQDCVGERHARGNRKRKSSGALQHCEQPRNNTLDILLPRLQQHTGQQQQRVR